LQSFGFFLLGRFAEWEYYNMDKSIEAAMTLADSFEKKCRNLVLQNIVAIKGKR